MKIKKNYDIGAIANEIKDRIMISSNGEVCIDVLLAQNIVDVLEEVSRREAIECIETAKPEISVPEKLQPVSPAKDGNEILPENMKAGCDDKPRCYGKYTVDNAQERDCTHCPDEGCCYLKSSCRKKCFGTYENDSSICANCKYICECKKESNVKDAHVGCMGEYRGKLHKKCLLCNLSYICKTKTTKRVKDITGCFGEYDDSAIVCSGCKYSTACEEITSEERDNA